MQNSSARQPFNAPAPGFVVEGRENAFLLNRWDNRFRAVRYCWRGLIDLWRKPVRSSGNFAAMEEPGLLAQDIRAFFSRFRR